MFQDDTRAFFLISHETKIAFSQTF